MNPIKTILVPTDFSEPSSKAFTYALELAGRFDARILVLHVWELPRNVGPDFGLYLTAESEVQRILVDDINRRLKEFVAEVAGENASVVDTLVVRGVPYECVVDIAGQRRSDLIVMGTHGRSGLKHFFLGSVAEKVVRHAPCPVLTIRDRPEAAAHAA